MGAGTAVAERQPTMHDAYMRPGTVREDATDPEHPAASTRPSGADQGPLDYDAIYAAVYESNAQVRYWLCDIYDLHGLPQNPQLRDAPHMSALYSPALRSLRLLLSVRHLVLELWNFQAIYGHYTKIKKDLAVEKTGGLDLITKDHKIAASLKLLRGKLAHPEITLGDFAGEIDAHGLDSFVRYARAVLMFEDAAYHTVSHRRHKPKNADLNPVKLTFEMPGSLDRDAFAKRYSGIDFELDPEIHGREYALMGDMRMSLLMLYTGFVEAAKSTDDNTLDSYLQFTSHAHNSKYMILDIDNFIKKFKKLRLQETVTPDFLSRADLYDSLRHYYSAHTRFRKTRTTESLLAEHQDLLSHMLLDILEIDALASRLLERFEAPPIKEISFMSGEQIAKIDEAMKAIQLERYGRSYTDPHEEEKRLEARAAAKRRLGLR